MARCKKHSEGLQLELEANEADLLRFMGRELGRLLENGRQNGQQVTAFSPLRQREQDEHAVTGDLESPLEADLFAHRLQRIESVQEELMEGSVPGRRLKVILDEIRCDIWLAYLTDVRLLLAEVIGITPEDPDPFDDDPEDWTLEMRMYQFLSVLQEWILDAME